jgi:hypothetical protein
LRPFHGVAEIFFGTFARGPLRFIDGKLQERKEAQTGTTDTNKTGSVAA